MNIQISEYERKAWYGLFIIGIKRAIVNFYRDNSEKQGKQFKNEFIAQLDSEFINIMKFKKNI